MDVYGLIGNPVGHSLSPPMHEAAYDELGLDARYVTFKPQPDEGVQAIESAATLGVRGLNVTVPFKQDALEAVETTSTAGSIGAVNTVDLSSDPPLGHNTDVSGLRRAFEHHEVALAGRAVVVGAGGAGRAAAFALADEGMAVDVANRTVERAKSLAMDVTKSETSGTATATSLDSLPELLADTDVLVNATTVGMDEDRSPVPASALHEGLAVLDAVYSPVSTRLLRDADSAGATTIDGLWMLLYQGVEAFEFWTGRTAPVEAMSSALRARVKSSGRSS